MISLRDVIDARTGTHRLEDAPEPRVDQPLAVERGRLGESCGEDHEENERVPPLVAVQVSSRPLRFVLEGHPPLRTRASKGMSLT